MGKLYFDKYGALGYDINTKMEVSWSGRYNPDYKFKEIEIETLEKVLDYYGDKEPQWLSELTHKERPWKET